MNQIASLVLDRRQYHTWVYTHMATVGAFKNNQMCAYKHKQHIWSPNTKLRDTKREEVHRLQIKLSQMELIQLSGQSVSAVTQCACSLFSSTPLTV